ncbi:MAG: hypothetical protein LBU73_08710 [Helicobacteraceae bacterium]|jgi:hypothetical protein|nr:hypothetical protein [Helicobacteraceae bacterium]
MKNLLLAATLAFFAANCASANGIKILEGEGRETPYTIAPGGVKTQSAGGEREYRYYQYGDSSREKVSYGEISVSFNQAPADLAAFAARYSLKNPRKTGKLYETYLFENHSGFDDLSLCAKIAEENKEALRFATPNFKEYFKKQ